MTLELSAIHALCCPLVPVGTNNGIATLVFPAVPNGVTGTTYARFRLSTDTAAADPFGPAQDGEVEDYAVSILSLVGGKADSAKTKKIASGTSGAPPLDSDSRSDRFRGLIDTA